MSDCLGFLWNQNECNIWLHLTLERLMHASVKFCQKSDWEFKINNSQTSGGEDLVSGPLFYLLESKVEMLNCSKNSSFFLYARPSQRFLKMYSHYTIAFFFKYYYKKLQLCL